MLKIFLVEETNVLEKIKQKIDWDKHNFCLVGEASDGETAYMLIKDTKPDILIVDLMIPYINGLELSSLVKKVIPDIRIIILSDYKQFFYAQSALRVGVSDFLIKPVKTTELIKSLSNAKLEIVKKQKSYLELYEKEWEEKEKMNRHHFFESLISGKFSVSEIIIRGLQCDINLAANAYNIILFEFCEKEQGSIVQMKEAEEKISNLVKSNEQFIYFDRGIEGKAVLIKGRSEREVEQEVARFTKELYRILQNADKLRYFAGVGKNITRLHNIPKCFFQANLAFTSRLFNEKNQIIFGSKIKNTMANESESISLLEVDMDSLNKKRIDFLKNGIRRDVEAFVEEFWNQIDTKNRDSVLFKQYILLDCNFAVIRFIKRIGGNKEHTDYFINKLKNIAFTTISREQIKFNIRNILDMCLKVRDEVSISRHEELVQKGKDFILKHYNKNNISLDMVAAHVDVSSNHFCVIFSKIEGLTFVEYLVQIRMNKAKEMLRCSRLNISEIGKSLGYPKVQYFCCTFKKSVGCTPGEYRMSSKLLHKNHKSNDASA